MEITGIIRKATAFPTQEGHNYSGLKIRLIGGKIINTNVKFFSSNMNVELENVDTVTNLTELVGIGIGAEIIEHSAGEEIPGKPGEFFKTDGVNVTDLFSLTKEEVQVHKVQNFVDNGISINVVRAAQLYNAKDIVDQMKDLID